MVVCCGVFLVMVVVDAILLFNNSVICLLNSYLLHYSYRIGSHNGDNTIQWYWSRGLFSFASATVILNVPAVSGKSG